MECPAEQGRPATNGAARRLLTTWAPLAGAAWCLAHLVGGPPAFSHLGPRLGRAGGEPRAAALRSAPSQAATPVLPSVPAQRSAGSTAWGGASLLAVAALLVAPRAGRQAKPARPRATGVLLAKPAGAEESATSAGRTEEAQKVGPDVAAVAALAAVAAAAAAAASPALAADVAEVASTAATAVTAAAASPEVTAVAQAVASPVAAAADAVATAAASSGAAAVEAASGVAQAAADAANSAPPAPVEPSADAPADGTSTGGTDFFEPWVAFNAGIIAGIDDVIEGRLNLPNTFGFAIIFYTAAIKLLTFPLNQTSLRSNAMMQLLQPKIEQINTKYKNDDETKNRMMLRLFDDCGVNPLGGCLPSLVQFPIFIGLYRAINRLAEQNDHFKEPFLWIPSLAGPVEIGKPSLDWLIKSKFEDHFEPLVGWPDAGRFLILPVALVASQYVTQKMSAPQTSQAQGPLGAVTGLFPLIIGYTTMVSPAGLGIYWFMNNLFTQAQTQIIRTGLANEFPEYKKIMDGTAAKEAAAKKAAEEADEQPQMRGFAASAPEPAPKAVAAAAEGADAEAEGEVIDVESAEPVPRASTPVAVPEYDPTKAAERRARRRRQQSKRRRR